MRRLADVHNELLSALTDVCGPHGFTKVRFAAFTTPRCALPDLACEVYGHAFGSVGDVQRLQISLAQRRAHPMSALEMDITSCLLRAERKRNVWVERREHLREMQQRERARRDREAVWALAIVAAPTAAVLAIAIGVEFWPCCPRMIGVQSHPVASDLWSGPFFGEPKASASAGRGWSTRSCRPGRERWAVHTKPALNALRQKKSAPAKGRQFSYFSKIAQFWLRARSTQ